MSRGAETVKKVPVIMQMEALECGAACLAMVLACHGKWLPLEQVRTDCGVSRDGSNAVNILKAARSYGMDARGYRYDVPHLMTEAAFPCMLFWDFNHFVVLCGFQKNQAVLNDPAKGRVLVSLEELDEKFTGICLQFFVTDAFVPGGSRPSIVEFARKRLQGKAGILAFLIITGLLTTLVGVVNPVFSRVFMDDIIQGENQPWLLPFLLLMTAVAVFQLILLGVGNVSDFRIRGKLALSANFSFMWHMLHLPMSFFAQRQAGDIAGRQQDNEGITASLAGLLAPLLVNFAMLLFYLLIMLRYSAWLTLIGVGTVVVNLFISRSVANRRLNLTRVMTRDKSRLSSSTVRALEIMESIKASGSEDGYFEQWSGVQASVNASAVRMAALTAWQGTLPTVLFRLAGASVLVLGVLLILNGNFTVGMLTAFQSFMSAFITPANSLLTAGQSFQEMRSSMERVEDVLRYPADTPETDIDVDVPCTPLSGQVDIQGLTFGYAPLAPPLIVDFELSLRPGQRVALVGASGCGKSTLARLVSGLYAPWSGSIRFDGRERSQYDRSVLCSSVAVVDQDIVLFADSIKNNITLWDDTIPEQDLVAAAKDACLHQVIMGRQGGFEAKVLEGGSNFSGGQRQCIEIARALVQKPSILLLDEATSALDTATEQHVMEAIRRRGMTCIIAAHRLSTIRDCDEILVMDHGRIIERGTHQSLYAGGGVYAELIAEE